MLSITDNLSQIHQKIEAAGKAADRTGSVRLLCVSKTKPCEMIEEAYAAGERHFGESYAVEAAEKIEQLKAKGLTDIVWHFIGPIQKNKTRLIAQHFDVVESLDRAIVADRLDEQRPASLPPLEVYIQVNISGEEQKSGCGVSELDTLIAHVLSKKNLRLKGLMGIARDTADEEEIAKSFALIHRLFLEQQALHPGFTELSIGMTHDLEQAVANGSTEVRIGTAIFGGRVYKEGRMDDKQKIAFIGGGNMASCIFESVIKHASPRNITVSGPHLEKLRHFKDAGASITTNNVEAAGAANIIFLGVKPQILTSVLEELAASGIDFEEKLVISMAAGFKLSSIERHLHSQRLVRIMPNTPARIGLGLTAVSFGAAIADPDREAVRLMLSGMGESAEGSEEQLNVIGAVAGCGPAFVYRFMEALVAESVRHGLDEAQSRKIVELLVKGSAQMVIENQDQPLSSLREAVTSKGGTTYAGLCKMTEGDFEGMMQRVIQASLDRTCEFEKMF